MKVISVTIVEEDDTEFPNELVHVVEVPDLQLFVDQLEFLANSTKKIIQRIQNLENRDRRLS